MRQRRRHYSGVEKVSVLRRHLFTDLDIVVFATTVSYVEGEGGQTLGRHGNAKDHRPDLKQMVVGVIVDGAERPVCCELWPGNTTDVRTLVPIVERLRARYRIGSRVPSAAECRAGLC